MSTEILEKLKSGNQRFTSRDFSQRTVVPKDLAGGQSPHTIVITCADSRVPPELIFDQDLGDLFVIRVAGNTSTDEAIGSSEYAVAHLGSKVLMVLGHTSCGAVGAAISKRVDGQDLPTKYLDSVVEPIFSAVDHCKEGGHDDMTQAVVEENVKHQVKELNNSPILKGAIDEGKLTVVGAVYHLDSGEVRYL